MALTPPETELRPREKNLESSSEPLIAAKEPALSWKKGNRSSAENKYMKTKKDIVGNWLPRYTGTPVSDFGKYLLLVNFQNYVQLFAEWEDVPIQGTNRQMPNATSGNISIINFGMGSANAATVMDLLSAVQPEARSEEHTS